MQQQSHHQQQQQQQPQQQSSQGEAKEPRSYEEIDPAHVIDVESFEEEFFGLLSQRYAQMMTSACPSDLVKNSPVNDHTLQPIILCVLRK